MTRGRNPLDILPSMAGDLGRVDTELAASVDSRIPFLTEIASHLITAGGKRIRPGFCIAAAATGLATDQPAKLDVIRGGAAVELVHLGSLYHDDVMDAAPSRHFVASVNELWGNHRAILAGDFLLARSSEIAASLGVEVAALLGATISRLVEGQTLEMQHLHDLERSEAAYWASIDGKTAALLATSCRVGGIVAGLPREHIELVTAFGRAYGTAFQVVDDVLDLVSNDSDMGKPTGHDMSEGVYTLPVLRHLAADPGGELSSLLNASMTDSDCARAAALVRGSGALDDAIGEARRLAGEAAVALGDLPPSPGVTALLAASEHLVRSVEAAAAHPTAAR
ncbi:MAG: polyprenyl synthetase family protein [Microthrixaceae bacterium]|nr:polyprenyl synthetase family protein [Microthrixaceae bacterium]